MYRAVDNAFIFQRKMDDYGKLFSIIEQVAKWFPELSGFNAGRKSSMELYDVYKVFSKMKLPDILSVKFYYLPSIN